MPLLANHSLHRVHENRGHPYLTRVPQFGKARPLDGNLLALWGIEVECRCDKSHGEYLLLAISYG
jgi:hypothetical protein